MRWPHVLERCAPLLARRARSRDVEQEGFPQLGLFCELAQGLREHPLPHPDVREQLGAAGGVQAVGPAPPAESDGGFGGDVERSPVAAVRRHTGGHVHGQHL